MSKLYMNNSAFAALLGLLLSSFWIASAAWPLDSDREQPIQITADSAIRDEIAGETRYEGNVVLTQGSLKITADRLSISHFAPAAGNREPYLGRKDHQRRWRT